MYCIVYMPPLWPLAYMLRGRLQHNQVPRPLNIQCVVQPELSACIFSLLFRYFRVHRRFLRNNGLKLNLYISIYIQPAGVQYVGPLIVYRKNYNLQIVIFSINS
jgi:hypothetical protein